MRNISIVVITLNEEKRIGRLLEDLARQTYRQFEVIVVDSNSDDETCTIAESYAENLPALTVHKMETRGVSLGRNTGADLAKYDTLMFLDADVCLRPDFIANAVQKLDDSGLEVAGVYLGSQGLPAAYKAGYSLINAGMFATSFFFPTAVGACIISSRRVHQQIGGFDTDIHLCEDCDYVKRAARTWRFRMLPLTFNFDPRRLQQDGIVRTGLIYLKANVRRFFFGEMRNGEMKYDFGHYNDAKQQEA